jgi:hypothetical protein
VVADQHRLPDRHAGPQAAGRVRQQHRADPGRGRGAHAVHHLRHAVPLVAVRPAEQHEHPPVADQHRTRRAAVADGGRRHETGQFGHRDLGARVADHVGRRAPTGTQHDGHVVARNPGAFGEHPGRRFGVGRVRTRHHAGEPTSIVSS